MTIEHLNNQVSILMEPTTNQEFAIDRLLSEFHGSVNAVAGDPERYTQMLSLLKGFNPKFYPIEVNTKYPKAKVLASVVAGIYAPLIHGLATTVVRNIEEGNLPGIVIAPPRDAIPLAVALESQGLIHNCEIQIIMPAITRNTVGIANNQKGGVVEKSPHLDLLLDQIMQSINGPNVVEIETGIYGTTSLVMAKALKARGLEGYYPIKFYGLGPNLSYVHAVLSGGREWIAEKAEVGGLVESSQISPIMALVDTMEELGMQNLYQSVEHLQVGENGLVEPVIVPVSDEKYEIARVTNDVIKNTVPVYKDIAPEEVRLMLKKVPWLIEQACRGFPLILTEPIPSMDSKEKHFMRVRKARLFDCPKLLL